MKAVTWKKNRIISIRLRNSHFALMQMLEDKGWVAVFNCFQETDDWDSIELTKENLLFTNIITRAVLKRSEIKHHRKVSPLAGLEAVYDKIDLGGGYRNISLWENTPNERSFLMMGEGKNKLRRLEEINGKYEEKYTPISNKKFENYKNFELTNLCDYPSFNERLYLSELFGENYDPLKEIAFDRPIRVECTTYVDIISSKVELSDLGY